MSTHNGVNGVCNGNGHHDHCTEKQNGVDKVIGIDNVNETDTSSYLANYNTHKPGISQEEMVKAYSDWANKYDEDLCPGRYNGPEMAAEALAKLYDTTERETIRILDVAAGTGRVGHELNKRGFKVIDALEPSSGMLKVLQGRNLYSTKYETPIGSRRTVDVIDPNLYDALVIAGGMGEGHIPVNAIYEMIRLVKSGGTILIVMREEYLSYVKEYVDTLEPLMEELEGKGYWKKLSRTIVPEYSFNKNGVIYAYKVTSDDSPLQQ